MSTVYNVELDYVLIEKIVMRAVLAAVAYNCVIVQINNPYHIAVTLDTPDLYVPKNRLEGCFLVIIHQSQPYDPHNTSYNDQYWLNLYVHNANT